MQNSTRSCACPDGIMPRLLYSKQTCKIKTQENKFLKTIKNFRCRSTGKPIQCPSGKLVDWSIGGMEEIAGCKIEDW